MLTQITSPPTEEPVTLAETKAHLRICHTEEDSLIQGYIEAARILLESVTNRRFITQTWKLFLSAWPADQLVMPFGRLQSVEAFTYRTEDEETISLTIDADPETGSTADYVVDTFPDPGVVSLAHSAAWPAVPLSLKPWPVRVSFVCGYGAAADVPMPLKIAIMQFAGHMYENREAVNELPQHVSALISEYRLWHF